MTIDLDEIKWALAESTPGPWSWREDRWNGGWSGLFSATGYPVIVPQSRNEADGGAAWFAHEDDSDDEGLSAVDAQLVANAPAWLAELVEEVERLREVEDSCREWMVSHVEEYKLAAIRPVEDEQK